MLIKLRRQQAELNSLREHTLSQLMALGIEGPNPKVSTERMDVAHVWVCARARMRSLVQALLLRAKRCIPADACVFRRLAVHPNEIEFG